MKLDSKYFDKIRVKKPGSGKPVAESVPQCDWPDCPRPSRHKAPMGRGHEGKFYNYCTEHVQEYNKTYNYFAGMKDDDVADFQKDARLGHRPTWKLGQNASATASSVRRKTGTPPSGDASLSKPIRRLDPAATRIAAQVRGRGAAAMRGVLAAASSPRKEPISWYVV